MPPNASEATPASSPSPASRYHTGWRAVSFFTVLLGFVGLACTGEIHPLAIVVFLAVWLSGLLATRPPQWWPRWMTPASVWGALILIVALAVHGEFASLLYLLMFLGLFKCMTLREPADHLQAMLVSFFMLLATSIITTSATFLLFVFCSMALITLELLCFNLARDLERAGSAPLTLQFKQGRLTSSNRKGLISRLWRASLTIGLIALTMAFGLFLLMPQYSAKNNLGSPISRFHPTPPPERQSGYGEEVSFGVFNRLSLDNTQALTARLDFLDPGYRRPGAIHLRGTSLDTYDEKSWTAQIDSTQFTSLEWSKVSLPAQCALQGPRIKQSISQKTAATGRFFSVGLPTEFDVDQSRPMQLQLNYRATSLMRVFDRGGWSQDFLPLSFDYTVYSRLNDDAAPLLRQLAGLSTDESSGTLTANGKILSDPLLRLPPYLRNIYTALPDTPLTQQIMEISKRQANAPDAISKMLQLLDWLQSDFTYSLTPETPPGMHPIEGFLTKTHKGHCEYFATAFCLLLRAQGIPTRLVTGFYTSEFNAGSDRYVARQSDAHAWSEAWLDGLGWLPLDPTPASARGRNSAPSAQPSMLLSLYNAMQSMWQQYILYYSSAKQEQMYVSLMTSRFMRRASDILANLSSPNQGGFNQAWNSAAEKGGRVLRYLSYGGALAGLFALHAFYRAFKRRKTKPRAARSPIPFMNVLLVKLQELGWRRAPGQTPTELLENIDAQTQGKYELGWILEIYHRQRFGGEEPNPAELARINETISNLE